MGESFDPYKDALVVEQETIWPPDGPAVDSVMRAAIEKLVHEQPQLVSDLTYVRLFTGFCRRITLTPEEIERLVAIVRRTDWQRASVQ